MLQYFFPVAADGELFNFLKNFTAVFFTGVEGALEESGFLDADEADLEEDFEEADALEEDLWLDCSCFLVALSLVGFFPASDALEGELSLVCFCFLVALSLVGFFASSFDADLF